MFILITWSRQQWNTLFSQQLPLPSASGSGSYARFSWPVCWIVLDFHLRQSERFTNDCEKLSRSSLEKKARQSGWLHCIQLHSDEWMIWGMKPSLKKPNPNMSDLTFASLNKAQYVMSIGSNPSRRSRSIPQPSSIKYLGKHTANIQVVLVLSLLKDPCVSS